MLILNEHFSGTNGASWPNWYTNTSSGASYSLLDGAGLVNGDSAWWVSWAGPRDPILPPDFDVVFRAKRLFNGGDHDWGIVWGETTLGSYGYTIHSQTFANWMYLYVSDFTTFLGDATAPNFTYLSTINVRVRQVGKSIKIKHWVDPDSEPVAWKLEVTDTTRNQRSYLALHAYDNTGWTTGQVMSYDSVIVDDLKATPTVRNTRRYRL